jgi:hypothetical protein
MPATPHFTSGQTLRLIALGLALWLFAALLLRLIIPMGALDGSMRLVTYLLVIPGTVPFIWLTPRIAQLNRLQIAPAVAFVTATALLCDGIAVAWYPTLYAADTLGAKLAAAAILWGAGVAIFEGFLLARHLVRD